MSYEYEPDIGVGDPRTLSQWAMYIATVFPDISGKVTTTIHGRKLKKIHSSGLEALLDQANKKDDKWYLFCEANEWLFYKFYKGKMLCPRAVDISIQSQTR